MEDYTVKYKIGDGAQGVVYAVEHNQEKKDYAMKVICCNDQEQVNLALKEIKVLLQLRHPHIVSYVDFFLVFNNSSLRREFEKGCQSDDSPLHDLAKDSLRLYSLRDGSKQTKNAEGKWLRDEEIAVCLVMELCSCGDVSDTIKEAKQKMMETGAHPLTEAQVLSWTEQCARALQFIHEKGFLHRDLKPNNIFFDTYRDVKLGDFGLAATVGLGRNSVVGTPYYLAPERMLQQRYDSKVDIWGLGVVLLEVLTLREQPINSMVLENPNVLDSVVSKITAMGFSSKLSKLVKDMLQRQPDQRPTTSAILSYLAKMNTSSVNLNLSTSVSLAGMSCPKMVEALCDLCEVESATVMCAQCKAAYCEGCDRARHRHHTRQNHERTLLSQLNSSGGTTFQQTLSTSRASENSRNLQRSVSEGRTYQRLQMTMPGNSLSASDFSLSHTFLQRQNTSDTVVRVPQDFETLDKAVSMVANMPQVRKIVVASNTVHNTPLTLTSALPDNIKIVGESPPPVLEVSDLPFALRCVSGKGVIENFIIRHVGQSRRGGGGAGAAGAAVGGAGGSTVLQPLHVNSHSNIIAENTSGHQTSGAKKPPRPNAVCIAGGEWRLHKCRISCVEGSGVTVGADGSKGDGASSTSSTPDKSAVDPVITKCTFIDITTAGVVVLEQARGLYEANHFSGCGYAAFLLKKDCAPRIRANHITDGAETGIFCQDGGGTIEYNLIAKNGGCGVVVRGPSAAPVFRKNRVLSNAQAGFFCCDRASPFISDNDIRQNHKAGVLIKTKSTPKVTKNVIEEGKEAGIYIFEQGAGIIEENSIRGNHNAGLLVTTYSTPHVINNTLTKNSYEGIWVCKNGGGTFCDNDLRGNLKGPMDVDKNCKVTWVGNVEK